MENELWRGSVIFLLEARGGVGEGPQKPQFARVLQANDNMSAVVLAGVDHQGAIQRNECV